MKRFTLTSFLLGTLALGLWAAFAAAEPQDAEGEPATTETAAEEKDEAKPVDVTAKMREYNSDKYAGPPSEFNRGHVKRRKLDRVSVVTPVEIVGSSRSGRRELVVVVPRDVAAAPSEAVSVD